MGEVRVFTAARSKRIEDTTIVSGEVNEVGELNLITRAGEVVYAGNIKGPQGSPGNGFNSFLITATMDFNVIKSPGLYHITSSAVAVACLNTPTYTGFAAKQPGYLLVEGNGSTYVKQTWTNFNNPAETLVRTLYSTWYAWAPPIELSSETQVGIARMATSAETQTGTSKVLAVTPFGLAARTATETRTGLVELATDEEALLGADATRVITPKGLGTVLTTLRPVDSGTALFRATIYPTSDAALANRRVRWFNTDTSRFEMFYMATGTTGLTVPGLLSGQPNGWYPVYPSSIMAHRGQTSGFQAITASAKELTFAPSHISLGGVSDSGLSGLAVPWGGHYIITARLIASGGASGYVQGKVYVNGSTLFDAQSPKPDSQDQRAHGSSLRTLSAGDVVSLQGQTASNLSSWGTTGYNGTFLEIEYKAPPLANY